MGNEEVSITGFGFSGWEENEAKVRVLRVPRWEENKAEVRVFPVCFG